MNENKKEQEEVGTHNVKWSKAVKKQYHLRYVRYAIPTTLKWK